LRAPRTRRPRRAPSTRSEDLFEGLHLDPSETLCGFRAQAPVFHSPKLGYWVVSRYADVTAVFRDHETFSPCIALEKITRHRATSRLYPFRWSRRSARRRAADLTCDRKRRHRGLELGVIAPFVNFCS